MAKFLSDQYLFFSTLYKFCIIGLVHRFPVTLVRLHILSIAYYPEQYHEIVLNSAKLVAPEMSQKLDEKQMRYELQIAALLSLKHLLPLYDRRKVTGRP